MLSRPGSRNIGHWGTGARVVVGLALIVVAIVSGVDGLDVILGLGVFPVAVMAVVVLRGRDAPPIRLLGPGAQCLNCALIFAVFFVLPEEALLFYGTSMLIAATRGYGGCELFALSNVVWHRDDQISCPLFHPIDRAERRPITRSAAP